MIKIILSALIVLAILIVGSIMFLATLKKNPTKIKITIPTLLSIDVEFESTAKADEARF